jgi:hypothetical protein
MPYRFIGDVHQSLPVVLDSTIPMHQYPQHPNMTVSRTILPRGVGKGRVMVIPGVADANKT